MSQICEYFHPEFYLNMFDGVFFMYLHIVEHKKPPEAVNFRILQNISLKQAIFCRKWVRKLKIAITQKHVFE